MKVGDLVRYRFSYGGWPLDKPGIIVGVDKVSTWVERYLVSWPGKPWQRQTWESPRDVERISEG